MFLGEESINKEEIIITAHALQRFSEILNKQLKLPRFRQRVKNIKFDSKRALKDKFYIKHLGIRTHFLSQNHLPYLDILRELLQNADHKKAIDDITRTRSLIKYRKETFFFRIDRWQFRITRSRNEKRFVLRTIIWLSERDYQFCIR